MEEKKEEAKIILKKIEQAQEIISNVSGYGEIKIKIENNKLKLTVITTDLKR